MNKDLFESIWNLNEAEYEDVFEETKKDFEETIKWKLESGEIQNNPKNFKKLKVWYHKLAKSYLSLKYKESEYHSRYTKTILFQTWPVNPVAYYNLPTKEMFEIDVSKIIDEIRYDPNSFDTLAFYYMMLSNRKIDYIKELEDNAKYSQRDEKNLVRIEAISDRLAETDDENKRIEIDNPIFGDGTRFRTPCKIKYRSTDKHEHSVLTKELKEYIFNRDNYTCKYCGKSKKTDPSAIFHCDHILPIRFGGRTDLNNLQTLCARCYYEKKSRWRSIDKEAYLIQNGMLPFEEFNQEKILKIG